MSKLTKRKANSPPLGKGLHEPVVGPLMSEGDAAALIEASEDIQRKRMADLADSLGIPNDQTRWYRLAFELARTYVPELMLTKVMGAPKKWGEFELCALVVELEREQRKSGRSQLAAAQALAGRQPWRDFLHEKSGTYVGPDAASALLKAFAQGKKLKLANAFRDAFKWRDAAGELAQWDADVLRIANSKQGKQG